MVITYDLPGWVDLRCDDSRMPNGEPFRAEVEPVALPIIEQPLEHTLPRVATAPGCRLSGQITVQSCTPGSGNAEVGEAVFNPNQRKVTTRPSACRPVDGADA
jgi:hypothetical protein